MRLNWVRSECSRRKVLVFFFFNDTATTEIYTLSLHDALPISLGRPALDRQQSPNEIRPPVAEPERDRKSTRLNSSHGYISYAVFCLKKKKITIAYIHANTYAKHVVHE